MTFDRVFGAGFWGLFCLSIGAMAAGALDSHVGGRPRLSAMQVACACGLLGAVVGAAFPPRLILPGAIRARRPGLGGDIECPMCGHPNHADATACPACGEPWVQQP